MCVSSHATGFRYENEQLTAATIMVCVLGVLLADARVRLKLLHANGTSQHRSKARFKWLLQRTCCDEEHFLERLFPDRHSDFRDHNAHNPRIEMAAEKVNASYVLYNVTTFKTRTGSEIFVLPNPSQNVTLNLRTV